MGRTLVLAAVAALATAASGATWSQSGHDAQRSRRSTVTVPGNGTLRWTWTVAGVLVPSIVEAADGTLIAVTQDSAAPVVHTRRADGSTRAFPLPGTDGDMVMLAAPAFSGALDAMYYTGANATTIASSVTAGAILWRVPIDGGSSVPPLLHEASSTLFVASTVSLSALSATDGAVRWRRALLRGHVVYALAANRAGTQVYMAEYPAPGLSAFDAATGALQWSALPDALLSAVLSGDDGRVFGMAVDSLLALDGATGAAAASSKPSITT